MEYSLGSAVIGGLLIGSSAALLLLMNGKIAGISGILRQAVFKPYSGEYWRWLFVVGIIAGGFLTHKILYIPIPDNSQSWFSAAIAGLLVGVGTRIGNGCTSGHGVCGIGRLSSRSIVATIVFMLVAVITVFIGRHIV